jgi:hypothetical protein
VVGRRRNAAIDVLCGDAAGRPARDCKNNHGAAVAGLDRDAFTVFENGRRQPITLFRHDDVPL